jgi:hypothetical protein
MATYVVVLGDVDCVVADPLQVSVVPQTIPTQASRWR